MTSNNAPPLPAPSPSTARTYWLRFRRPVLVMAVIALLATGGYFAWHYWFGQGNANADLITAVAQRGNLEDAITATGILQPKDYVDVGTQVSGQLKRLLVDVGAVVKPGQLLAEVDPSVYQAKVDGDRAQLLNQQAQLADKQAQLALAELQLTREKNLTREDATTADALQIAEAARKSALAQGNAVRAQIQQTGSTLRGDQANLGYTKIYAPIAGTVVSLAAKQGQTLNANQQAPVILRIADLATMTVQAQVSEADVSKLQIGMEVYFTTLGGDNLRYYGKLRQIPPTPTLTNNVVLYDALFEVANPKRVLLPQMTAQVFFISASAKDAVLVPLAALQPVTATANSRKGGKRVSGNDPRAQFGKGVARVSVVGEDGKVSVREVKVGVMNRVYAQIVSGIEAGDKVVIGTKAPAVAKAQTGSALVPSASSGGGRHP